MKDTVLTRKLFYKKIRDMKLSRKILFFMFLTAVLISFLVGFFSYRIARRELLASTGDAILSIQKQGGKNLDDRTDSFRDLSYRLLQGAGIQKLLAYSREEAIRNRIANEGLPAVINTHATLYDYTDYAFLRPSSGMVYEYYRDRYERLEGNYRDELLDQLEGQVSRNQATAWLVYDGRIYFVRKILSTDFKEQGILCFAVSESFFSLFGEDMDYLSDDDLIVLTKDDRIIRCKDDSKARDIVADFDTYEVTNYQVRQFEKTWDGDRHTVTILNTPDNYWTIISYFSHKILFRGIRQIYQNTVIMMAVAFVISFLVTWLIAKIITRNIVVIEKGLKEYEAGHLNYRISPASYDEIGLLALQLNYMAMQIHGLMGELQLKESEKRQLEMETLQAQINPHFLYNTLGSLRWEAYRREQPEMAEFLDALIQLLRFTIKKADAAVTVREEIDYVKNYIAIERMRYGDQFTVLYHIQKDTEEIRIPGFVLQPIVENCLLHGLEMTNNEGIIEISSQISDEFLMLEVRDNGAGMSEEEIASLLAPRTEKKKKGLNSIGMSIVDKRLHELYGEEYRTVVWSEKGYGTAVTLKIPYKRLASGEDGV